MDFTIDPGSTFFSELSTFTLDDGGGGIFAASFTQWNIITVPPFGVTFSGLTPAVPATISRNEGTGPAPFFEMILTQSDGGVALNLNLESNFTWHAVASKNNGVTVIQDVGRYSAVASSVPEPAVLVLLATGLLVLAGSRWLLRRGALQQLG